MVTKDLEYLRTPEAASLLRVATATLAKWRTLGLGPQYHKIGHLVLYRRVDITDWILANRQGMSDAK